MMLAHFSRCFNRAVGAVTVLVSCASVSLSAQAQSDPTGAAALVVTTTADAVANNGVVSLREAVGTANANADASTISFNIAGVGPHTITLTSILPNLTQPVNLDNDGPGVESVTLSGNNAVRIFIVNTTATVAGLTLANGFASSDGGAVNVTNSRSFTAVNCTFRDNRAQRNNNPAGGAITASNGSTLSVFNCTFSGNSASSTDPNGDSTGGAVFANFATTTLRNCTISSNSAGFAGGVSINGGTLIVANTIIAGNTGFNPDLRNTGTQSDGGGNIIGGDPGIGPLQNNGGGRETRALLSGSPAINAGVTAQIPPDIADSDGDDNTSEAQPFDERGVGFPRVLGTAVDSGAFEVSDPTGAAALVVTTTADTVTADGLISLREAINTANSDGVASAITFSASVFGASRQTITLNGTQLPNLVNNDTLSITAPAAGVEINGNNQSRVLRVNLGANATLTGLTIRGGNGGSGSGGGILNGGTLLVDSCTLTGNTAFEGGGIYSDTELNSTTLTLRNSTLSGNTATNRGGALFSVDGPTIIESSTISGNTAPNGQGGGVASFGDNFTRTEVRNSIISGNSSTDVDFVLNSVNNSFLSNGFNLIGDGNATGDFNQSGDVINNTDPGLAALAENGGRTPTRALLSSSPAVNTGDTTLTVDQRGTARPQGGADDKGAFESAFIANRAPVVSNFSVSATEDVTFTFAENSFDAAFSDPDGNTLQSVRIVTLPGSGTLRLNGVAVIAGQTIARGDLDTLTFAPVANFNGSTSLSYNASDGTLFAAQNATLTINVQSVNDAPTISAIADQITNEDTATPAIAFTVGDVETAPGSLTLAATSNNTALVPVANIVFGGSGANRTVTVTPAPNASGSATITVTVSDGTTGASEPFVLSVTAVNDAPTLDPIGNLSISEDAGTQTVNLSGISAGGGESQTLTITATSDNPALIPNPSVSYSSPNTTGSLSFTPVANASGTALITVSVSDGVTSVSRTFTVTVGAVNDAPSISDIADQNTNEDTATSAIAFTIGDSETAPGALTVSATSSNTSLVPQSGIAFGGSGANRTITLTPAANASGTTTITVSVSDGTTTTSDSFVLTVMAVNDAPSAPVVTAPATVIQDSSFSVSASSTDVENQALTYNFVLRRGGDVLLSASSTTGSVVFDLSTTAGENAGDVLTVEATASDGAATSAPGSANTSVVAADPLVVTTLGDTVASDGLTSLREAILFANRTDNTSPQTITFAVQGTITLASALPRISSASESGSLAIRNTQSAGVAVSGGGAVTIFSMATGADVTLDNLALINAKTAGVGGAIDNAGTLSIVGCVLTGNSAERGGAIHNSGTLFVSGSTLSGNPAGTSINGDSFSGGALFNRGTATIIGSTFAGNSASGGGAIRNGGTLTLVNCTLSGNAAGVNGGGAILNSGGTLNVRDCTIAGNTATNVTGVRGGGAGGGIRNTARSQLTLQNSIVAGNSAETNPNIDGPITGGSNNLTSGDPRLGALADNGGPTQTMLPQAGSPALNAGSSSSSTDQRGVARPQGSAADIGAVEVEVAPTRPSGQVF